MPVHTHIITKPSNIHPHQPLVLAIGNMDGVHLGHVALLKITHALAVAEGYRAAVLTFEPHPRVYFKPELKPLNILSIASKITTLQQHAMDTVIVARFNKALADMPAERFIEDFCVTTLGAKHVVTGANFRFGKGRAGDASLMADMMRSLSLGYSCAEPVVCETGEVISSTRIREHLKKGDVIAASALLGRPYSISGRVIHGDKRGSAIGFPTANIRVGHLALPAFGVYAVEVTLDGQRLPGVANIGMRPTFDKRTPLLEVHLFDFDKSIYGKRLEVAFKRFLRAEQKFVSVETMIDQLKRDVIEAKQVTL